ncbi:MAG TPA: hypothetical protein VFY79_05145 [Dehalococcoidia bacterium]|nr:hypothetical protein [Dehalococcoidia bacterium]
MRKLALIAIPALVAGLMLAACGGGSSSKTINVPGQGQVKVTTGDKPPSDFPSDFPIYDGAKYKGGVSTTEQGVSGFYANWQTGDSTDKVLSWYDDKFTNSGTWKKTATVNSGSDGAFISVERKDDASKVGFVSVTGDSGKTDIGIIVGTNPTNSDSGKDEATATSSDGSSADSTATSGDSGSASLPDEVTLSSDFPNDRVPLPSDVRVTGSSSVTSGADKVDQVEFYTKESAEELASYFKTEMPKHNWAQAISSSTAEGTFMTFAGSQDEVLSVQIQPSDVSGYQQVAIVVTVASS